MNYDIIVDEELIIKYKSLNEVYLKTIECLKSIQAEIVDEKKDENINAKHDNFNKKTEMWGLRTATMAGFSRYLLILKKYFTWNLRRTRLTLDYP
jgi:hypothetical protein